VDDKGKSSISTIKLGRGGPNKKNGSIGKKRGLPIFLRKKVKKLGRTRRKRTQPPMPRVTDERQKMRMKKGGGLKGKKATLKMGNSRGETTEGFRKEIDSCRR